MIEVTGLKCEWKSNPLGIDVRAPRLSWKMRSERRGARQTAYQVLVGTREDMAADGKADLWDSGRVVSDQSAHVVYGGRQLVSRQRAWWTARIWDELGQLVESSETGWWEMGLLQRSDWQAQWIGAGLVGGPRTAVPCPFLRKTFSVGRPVACARLYVTALGLHEPYLNGQRVGTDAFVPGWTDYRKRVQYQVYDVTPLLRQGANVLGAILGDGWYCGHTEKLPRQLYGDRPRLLAQLEIQSADGEVRVIPTDASWRVGFGPILESDIIMGEAYDARLEMPGWNLSEFDDSAWQSVVTFPDCGAALVAMPGPPVRPIQELQPVADPKNVRNEWIVDLGQNITGRVRLKASGKAGATVRMRFAEMLKPDGSIYTENLRTARATDYYTLRGGEGEEVYESHFTFHGFRYVELTGFPGTPTRESITGVVLHSDMAETGTFECSDPLINRLQSNIKWGQKGNYLDVPTDCPQRDERMGWTGDAQVFAATAAFNMDVAGFFAKWIQDLRDAQSGEGCVPAIVPITHPGLAGTDGGPAWADAMVICPWTMYLSYGDKRIIEEHYDSMVRYVEYLRSSSRDFRRCWDGCKHNQGFGDWLAIDGSNRCEGGTPRELIGTAFFAYVSRLASRIAGVLGRETEAAGYEELFRNVRAAFQRRFVTPDGLIVGQTQTAYVLALHFDLMPEHLRASATAEIVRDIERRGMHLSTGFVGSPYLPHVLTREGRSDVAYALLMQKTWPSWLYAVTQGATTIWERWDGWTSDKGFQDPGMNSFNHYAYGSIGEWLYASVAGIGPDPASPGYKHVILRPHPGGGLSYAGATIESIYGRVTGRWWVWENGLTWEVTVPPNTTATAYIPCPRADAVTEGGGPLSAAEGVSSIREADGAVVCELASGAYRFEAVAAGK